MQTQALLLLLAQAAECPDCCLDQTTLVFQSDLCCAACSEITVAACLPRTSRLAAVRVGVIYASGDSATAAVLLSG